MIKEFNMLWEKHKNELEEYIKTHDQDMYEDYIELVKLIVTNILNKGEILFNVENITEIVSGGYQGILIFIIPENTPGCDFEEGYVWTSVKYGSCSWCDTLQSIRVMEDTFGLPTKSQVKEYMTLCLHLFQKLRWLVPREE